MSYEFQGSINYNPSSFLSISQPQTSTFLSELPAPFGEWVVPLDIIPLVNDGIR